LLDRADRTALLGVGRRGRWQRGEPLLRAGDRADHAIILMVGFVKIHLSATDGAEVVVDLAGPGDLLGEAAAFSGGTRSASATALEPVEGLTVDIQDFRGFISRRPRVTFALLEMALARLQLANARRSEYATTTSLARVASRLVELTERFGASSPGGEIDVALPITQEELASWSATSRESTARALRTLRTLGLIQTRRRRLIVGDLGRLRAHAAP
jgi:CRP/FNR family transcriptional regulator, cyclic AMP receptor protein